MLNKYCVFVLLFVFTFFLDVHSMTCYDDDISTERGLLYVPNIHIDSVLIQTIPSNIFTSRSITRESFSDVVHQVGSQIHIEDSVEISAIRSMLLSLASNKKMQFDSKHIVKHALLFPKITRNRIAWFNDDVENISSLIVIFAGDEFELIWISELYVYYGSYQYLINDELKNYINDLPIVGFKESK